MSPLYVHVINCGCYVFVGGLICTSVMDLVLILDSSTSVGQNNWDIMIDFLVILLNSLDLSTGVRVAVVQFGTDAEIIFDFDANSDKEATVNAVRSLVYYTGPTQYTNIAKPFRLAKMLFQAGGRSGVPWIVLFFTDGKPTVRILILLSILVCMNSMK